MRLAKKSLPLIAVTIIAAAMLPAAIFAQVVLDRTGAILIRGLDGTVTMVEPGQPLPPILPNSTIELVNKCATFAPAKGFLQVIIRGCAEFTTATGDSGDQGKTTVEATGGMIVAVVTVQAGDRGRVCTDRGLNSCYAVVESLKGDIRVVMADTDALIQTGVKAQLGFDCTTSIVDLTALIGRVTGMVCKAIECNEGDTVSIEPGSIRKKEKEEVPEEPEEPEIPEGSPYQPHRP